ncbi:glycogen/starch synthase, ADP-glucose type [Paenibacillus curdlanolyticus YK9]|uniref:Glycogen synthase n=1 Tax=Paenibacillus curdlanolyticus YK9 TaxID=717606 RepID=E0I4Z1_9BACL|nr:glycogen synthase [Paenibacillus curdlanolyticus]EFM12033.1 glycogen/starch synthase, ADP-glucose type [Paenibacillus curdlanolyticus YK9]
MSRNILFVTSQMYPFVTGTMGIFNYSLPKKLAELGWDARVIVPRIRNVHRDYPEITEEVAQLFLPMGERLIACRVVSCLVDSVTVYLIDAPDYFDRPNLYGYEDEAERFGLFCKAVLAALPLLAFKPQLLHLQDWHTGLIPMLMETKHAGDPFYEDIQTLLTIHNLGYQGIFDRDYAALLDLQWEDWVDSGAAYYDQINFMKAGILHADAITTVSPSYAKEIATKQYGSTLEEAIQSRSEHLFGVLCGLDLQINDPSTDSRLHVTYDADTLERKAMNKAALQQALGFPIRAEIPVLSLFSRLKTEKGLDLVVNAMDDLMRMDVQFVIVSNGDDIYEDFFREAALRYPDRFAFVLYDNDFAYQAYAGSDMFLMPSGYEPCGIGQLIALRYGAVPIVRQVGGLSDSIQPFDEQTGEGNGFVFKPYFAKVMLYTIRKAIEAFHRPDSWRTVVQNGMREDHSWNKYTKQYADVYERVLNR